MAVQADGDRAVFTNHVNDEDEDFPVHTARGARRPLMLLAAVAALALLAWLFFIVSHRFMG